MLVLSRQKDETVVIGNSDILEENIRVTIVDVRGGKVILGIIAPGYPVHRREIYDAILREGVTEITLDHKGGNGNLVLSRQKDEEIIIGRSIKINENILITIVGIHGDKVRLGITAMRNIPVHRKEVWLVIQTEKD